MGYRLESAFGGGQDFSDCRCNHRFGNYTGLFGHGGCCGRRRPGRCGHTLRISPVSGGYYGSDCSAVNYIGPDTSVDRNKDFEENGQEDYGIEIHSNKFIHTGMPAKKAASDPEEEKIMKKKAVSLIIAAVFAVGALAGCGSKDDGTIKVAATEVPHAEILEAAKPILAEKGWDLQVTVFSDYVQPNEVVEAGDFDCNYFQHTPYLDSFNQEKGTHLVNVGEIHYEPLGIYGGTESDLANISDGATIAVPNDTTNEARALLLLQDNGIITLKDGAGMEATKNDIAENPHNVEIIELEAAQVARVIEETSFVVLNGNYALQAGLNAQTDALAYETSDSEAAKTYVNVVVVKEGNEGNEGVKALVEVLKSDEISNFINEKYQGSVVPFK